MTDYFLFSIFRAMNRLSPRRYTNNLFKVRQFFFHFALFFFIISYFPQLNSSQTNRTARERIAQPADESTSHSMKCFKRPMEEARGDSMKDYFLFSIFRVVSGAKPTEVV